MQSAVFNSSVFYRYWRVAATAIGFSVFGVGTLFMSLILGLLLAIAPIKTSHKQHFSRDCIRQSARLYIAMLGCLGLVKSKSAKINRCLKGSLVIANHPMLLDAVFLMAVIPQATFIIKSSLANNPFLFALIHHAGYIRNDTGGEALMKSAAKRILRGETLVIFPEGTRSSPDQELRLKRGAANIALMANCDIHILAIQCTPPLLRKTDPWYYAPEDLPHYTINDAGVLSLLDFNRQSDPAPKLVRRLNRLLEERLNQALQNHN